MPIKIGDKYALPGNELIPGEIAQIIEDGLVEMVWQDGSGGYYYLEDLVRVPE